MKYNTSKSSYELINYIISKIDNTYSNYFINFFDYKNEKPIYNYKINYFNNRVISNPFLDIFNKNESKNIRNLFYLSQKVYWGFTKLALIFKIRKTKTFDNDKTLYGDDLELFKKHNQVICLIENDTKYYFRVNELMKIWNVGLIKNTNLKPEPVYPRNPFTQKNFSKHNLFNIYFHVFFNTNLKISPEINQFIKCECNLKKFKEMHYTILKEYAIKDFLKKSNYFYIFYELIRMIKSEPVFDKHNKINVNMENYLKSELITILQPFLYDYIIAIHSPNCLVSKKKYRSFKKQARKFIDDNPTFGRTILAPRGSSIERNSNFNRFAEPRIIEYSDEDEDTEDDDYMEISDNEDNEENADNEEEKVPDEEENTITTNDVIEDNDLSPPITLETDEDDTIEFSASVEYAEQTSYLRDHIYFSSSSTDSISSLNTEEEIILAREDDESESSSGTSNENNNGSNNETSNENEIMSQEAMSHIIVHIEQLLLDDENTQLDNSENNEIE
jgi:hypothetical protein